MCKEVIIHYWNPAKYVVTVCLQIPAPFNVMKMVTHYDHLFFFFLLTKK
jgi:hypothetical protein